MTETTRPLSEILDELNDVLEASPELGEEGREALKQVAGNIRSALEESPGDHAESLSTQLSQALEQFEGSHPKLTHIVGRVLDALSDLGI
jgi:hypothetical protein